VIKHEDDVEFAPLPTAQHPEREVRRIEDWIVSNLDGSHCPIMPSLHSGGDGAMSLRRRRHRSKSGQPVKDGWSRVRVTEDQGIAVVLLVDRSIVEERNIQEVETALRDLIAAGSTHIVIDFDLVERCSSRFLATLAQFAQRCRTSGGLLKVCGLRNGLGEFFSLLDLRRVMSIALDVSSAVSGPWPARPPASLPVSVLSALRGRTNQARELICCVASDKNKKPSRRRRDDWLDDFPAGMTPTDDLVARWLIEGRDDDPGDDSVDEHTVEVVSLDELDGATVNLWDRAQYDGMNGEGGLKCELIEGVLVVTVMMPALTDPSAINKLRETLVQLYEQTPHRRVVVSLCNVAFMSSSAVGVLVAHMLKLEWAGGGLRLCHILPPVMAVLKKINLPMLVETYPTLDEAVLAAWR
jgi:anti-anti-sigma factor